MWIFCLVVTLFIYSIYAFLCYYDGLREKWWFIYALLLLSNIGCIAYGLMATMTKDNNQLYFRSLVWDVMVISAFASVPIVMGALEMNRYIVFGVVLIVIGLFLVKANS